MTIFLLKIIACSTMFIDHIKYAIPVLENDFTNYIGRISFPLFAFFIGEGYLHTKDIKKYYLRLFIFAIISQVPFMLFRTLVGEWKMLNVIFTLLLGLTAILIYDKGKEKLISLIFVGGIAYLGKILKVDYGWYGVLAVFIIYILKNHKVLLPMGYGILLITYYYTRGINLLSLENIMYFISTLISIFLIISYNGKKGKSVKYFFYAFYPLHMLLVYFIGIFLI